ncbi:hypothetical protein ccbrp13_12630 [Ktedonobacteria bacterium brp13]|nr:hypothetical protein ccbrp13_12630 [Ktedonobacteria bacterium brp13]
MTHEVSRSGPQTWEIALNREHWDKNSWANRSTSRVSSEKVVNNPNALGGWRVLVVNPKIRREKSA